MSHMTSRRQRLRGRLGIDVASQSPPVVLPPIHTSPRRVGLPRQQQEEVSQLVQEFRQRLETTRALGLDLTSLAHAVSRALEATANTCNSEEGEAIEDCFSAAKRLLSSIKTDGAAPFLGQFLGDIVHKIERFTHEQRHHEALVLDGPSRSHAASLEANSVADDSSGDSSSSISSFEFSPESSDDDSSPEVEASTTESDTHDGSQNLRHVPKRAVFRTTLRSRKFPSTHVPATEFVHKTSAYMPFELLKRSPDVASLRMEGHNELGSAQWRLLLFPKTKPSWSDHEELEAFAEWVKTKLGSNQHQTKQSGPVDAASLAETRERFKHDLALKELVCYELCRFVFDKCPTTARFLHGLFLELVDVTLRALASAEREQQIMEQRHKNVQLELTRLRDKLVKVQRSFESLEETLAMRQQRLLRERELIIRKRKKLNMLLSADQVLIRRLIGLIHHVEELADDALVDNNSNSQSLVAPHIQRQRHHGEEPTSEASRFSVVDEIIALVVDKYGGLPQFQQTRLKEATQRAAAPTALPPLVDSHDPAKAIDAESREVIVLDSNDVKNALDEYRATLLRLSRMLSTKSPDSSIGWDAQELWDQALFIPPHEEVQDLETDVQRLCLLVEGHILRRRQRRAMVDSVQTVAVQTDISACMPRGGRQLQSENQRWRARQFTPNPQPSSPKAPVIPRWKWRHHSRRGHRRAGSSRTIVDLADNAGIETAATISPALPAATTTVEEDHRNLMATVVPQGFRAFIRAVPPDYVPHQLSLHQVHNVISYLFNGVWMLVQEDFHRPPRFSTTATTNETRLIPLSTIHEYLYRIHLQHFHVESVVTSRLLDLLVSASRLDTQSCKIQLFCRLLGMPGVTSFPGDGFWFVLKALHVLQRCCASTGGYFLLDAEGDNEFVPQVSAAEALSQLFAGSSNEVLKRLRLKLSGLASVYGTMWIPAYNILTFVMDEWQTAQDTLRLLIEEKLFVEHASETDPFTGIRIFTNENNIVTFSEFLQGFAILQLDVSRSEALQAYRQLLLDATVSSTATAAAATPSSAATRIDRHRFYMSWMQMILHAVNVSQQQMLRPHNAPPPSVLLGGSSNSSASAATGVANPGPGVQLGAIADAMVSANQHLAHKFLVISWDQMKPEVIRRLDEKFNDVGQQMRLVQQMDAVIARHLYQTTQHLQRDDNSAWRSFHHLIQVAYTHSSR